MPYTPFGTVPKCPKCDSKNIRCWEEHDELFEDKETGELFEAPIGFIVCNDCQHDWADYSFDAIWVGEIPDDWGYDY